MEPRVMKLRAWDKDRQRMLQSSFIGWNINSELEFRNGEIPLLCTGLHDKNGKEIYHKDVLKDSDIGELWLVEWSDEYAGFELQRITENTIKVKGILEVISACRIIDYEYIGNIWESPELLEDKN